MHIRRGGNRRPLVALVWAVGLAFSSGKARADYRPDAGWVAGGIGLGKVGSELADAERIEVSILTGMHMLSLRYANTDEDEAPRAILFPFANLALPRNSDRELALLYGIAARSPSAPRFLATASAGAAAVWTVQRGSTVLSTDNCGFFGNCQDHYNSTERFTVGAALETGVYFNSRYLSLGATLMADLNAVQSCYSVLLDLHIGRTGSPAR